LEIPGPLVMAFGFNRSAHDFSERERLVLNVLRPHLLQAYHHAKITSRMRTRLAALGDAVESAGLGVVLLTADRRVAFMTSLARCWLETYFVNSQRAGRHLPDDLRRWVQHEMENLARTVGIPKPRQPLVVMGADRRLEIALVSNGEHPMLILEERREELEMAELVSLGLSRRETEVLAWIARGKSDAETAMILGISARTVAKHLEHIFQKLGVESRMAAAVLALGAAQHGRRGATSRRAAIPDQ
jgi:DNA-binding CsgD family transcriptional regulator